MKKNTTILRAMNDIRADYILESELSAEQIALHRPPTKREAWRRVTSSGWFAAAACAIVAFGTLTAIVLAGQNGSAPPTPAGTVTQPPVIEATTPEEETETPLPPYTEGLEYRIVTPTMVEVVGIGTAADATVIHIPPTDEEGREVIRIKESAFAGNTNITEVIITPYRDGLIVARSAFENCTSLQRITVSDGKAQVNFSYYSFSGCTSLSELNIPAQNNVNFADYSLDGTAWLEAQTDEFVSFNGILLKYQGNDSEVVIPDDIRAIVGGAFDDCPHVISVTASENAAPIEIQLYAFNGATSLETVNLPNLTAMYGSAFEDCPALKTVYLPSTLRCLADGVPDCSATFLYTGTTREWKQVYFVSDELKAEWEARITFQEE
jgi:hypothetical protein